MAFCAKCGAQVVQESSFCPSCGTPVGSGGPAAPAVAGTAGTAMASNVAGLLTYVLGFITGIIFLVIDPYKNDRFVRFHAFQSIFFNVALIVFWIAYSTVARVLGFVSLGILYVLMAGLGLLLSLAILAYWIFLMYKAYNNETYKVPFIGDLAAKQAG
jgi:uncharacterized membrane protein